MANAAALTMAAKLKDRVSLPQNSEFVTFGNLTLALDKNGNLYIAEDPATASTTGRGDDVWVAVAPKGGDVHSAAADVIRFATLTDCSAEPTGIYFDVSGTTLFVHAQHRGGDGRDKDVAITKN